MDQAHRPSNTEPPARHDDAPATVPQGGPVAGFFNRPLVLVTLLALVVGAIVWAFTRPGGTDGVAEEEPSSDHTALRRATASAKLMHFTSEAQRLYRRGLGQCREGD